MRPRSSLRSTSPTPRRRPCATCRSRAAAPPPRKAYTFGRRIASSAIFRESDIDELDGLLAPLRAQVEEGWVTEVIVDECCAQGGWTQRRLTPDSEALAARLHPVERLLTALRAVRNQRNAMRIAERFHEADAR